MSENGPAVAKPGPVRTPTDEPFWDAASRGELLVQRCGRCGHVQHYPRTLCARCWSHGPQWTEASGFGRVWTFTIVHRPGHPAWRDEVPYPIALVELAEGPRLMTRLVGVAVSRVRVGMPVHAVFEEVAGTTLVHFAPDAEHHQRCAAAAGRKA